MPECCNNLYSGWYCPRCGTPVSFIDHGGSEPVPIGQLSTKNVTVNQQLIQGDFIAAGGTKIGTNLGTAVSGNVTVGSLGEGPAPEKPLPPPPPVDKRPSLPPPPLPTGTDVPPPEEILPPPPEEILPPPPSDMAHLPPALPVLDDTLPTPPPGLGDLPPALPVLDDTLPTPPPGLGDSLPPPPPGM